MITRCMNLDEIFKATAHAPGVYSSREQVMLDSYLAHTKISTRFLEISER